MSIVYPIGTKVRVLVEDPITNYHREYKKTLETERPKGYEEQIKDLEAILAAYEAAVDQVFEVLVRSDSDSPCALRVEKLNLFFSPGSLEAVN